MSGADLREELSGLWTGRQKADQWCKTGISVRTPAFRIILEKPFAFEKDSVWNGNGNNYFVNGKKIKFSVKDLKNKDADVIRKQYEELKAQNTYQYFEKQMERFILCNKERYNRIVEEAKGYIRSMTENFDITDMFVSFSGGKDSTVTADLVTRALSNPQIMHIFA